MAPLSNPLHVVGTAEVILVGGLAQPAPLTGGLAGAATLRRQAVKLALGVMPVGMEELIAAAALASLLLGTHRASSWKKIQPPVQSQTAPPRKNKTKKEEKLSRRKREEHHPEEDGFSKRRFPTTFIPPLTLYPSFKCLRADPCGLSRLLNEASPRSPTCPQFQNQTIVQKVGGAIRRKEAVWLSIMQSCLTVG